MKRNTWVFYFFILLFTGILSINLVWRFTPIRAEISSGIQQRLRPYLGDSFALSDFSIGFGYMAFYNIVAGSEEENYILTLDEIQVGYSIHKLVLNKFDPLKVIESITFKNPNLILWTDKKAGAVDTTKSSISLSQTLAGFDKLAEIDRILIKQGRILWGKSPQTTNNLVSELDGYLLIRSEADVTLNLKGKLFESTSRALTLIGDISLRKKTIDIQAEIKDGHLKENIPFLSIPAFYLKEANLAGRVHITSTSLNINDISFYGSLAVRKMNALVYDQKLKTDDFYIHFDQQKMLLSPVSGEAQDGRFILTGHLGDIFHPGPYFSIDFEDYSVKHLVISVPILELLNQGKIQGHININGPVSQIQITGRLYASQMSYSIVPFYRTSLNFVFKDKIWTFNEIETSSIGLQHHGSGYIDFNQMNMFLQVDSDRPIEPDIFPILNRLNNTRLTYHTVMNGDFPSLTFEGDIEGGFYRDKKDIFTTAAHFVLVDDQISIQNNRSFPGGLRLHSQVNDLWTNPTFEILDIKNVPFDSLGDTPTIKWVHEHYQNDFYVSGPVNFPSAKVNFRSRKTEEILFSLTGNVTNLIHPELKFTGHFALHTLPEILEGDIQLEYQPEFVKINLEVPAGISGEMKIGYGEHALLEGEWLINQIPINEYLGRLENLAPAIQEGMVQGSLQLNGYTDSPEISFDLQGQNFIINRNGYYSATLTGTYRRPSLQLSQAQITYNNHPIMRVDLEWDLMADHLNSVIKGEKIESNFIAATIFKDPHLIQGDMNYQLHLQGNSSHPRISGSFQMDEGIMKGRAFRNLHVDFKDSIPPAGTLLQVDQHLFQIINLVYTDIKNYTIEISGQMPANPTEPMNLNVSAEGNILAELPNFINYFQNPLCVGEMQLNVTGTRENPKIESGKISIYNGSLEFASVIPPLKELKANIELKSGEQFIHIWNLEGKINNRGAKIYNLDSVRIDQQYLSPWNFEDVGLNFGILVLETDKRGIPLSIPGLMNPGDIGYFATSGKQNNEKFYFCGPVEKPVVRGSVLLSESRVTFPFLVLTDETYVEEEDVVLDFLMNIDWDVRAVAGVGNRYFVDIPAVLGEVYLDLNIDNVSEGLEFTGQLNDESFRVGGSVESTRGRVEYLDINFRVERFGAIFNKFELFPEVYGKAYTTVRDSTDFPRDVYLVLYAIDPETKQEVSRGRWEDFRFKLISSDPTIGETQENVLAYLGYSVDNISSKASDVGMTLTNNLLIRPLVRPLERKMERGLRLDYVRLSLQITSNLFYYGIQPRWKFLPEASYLQYNYTNSFDPALLLLQSSEITLGKYLLKDIYFSYSGQLVSVYDEPKFGLNHRIGIEYRLLQNLLLEFEYDKFYFDPKYYKPDALHDFRIRLKHSFNF